MYEKGKQPEYLHLGKPDWCRLELQVRPAKEAKEAFATLSPSEVWGASKWSRALAAKVLDEHISPHPAGTTYRLSERDKALSWMVKQYGHHLVGLASDLGGWECVGLTLRDHQRSGKGKMNLSGFEAFIRPLGGLLGWLSGLRRPLGGALGCSRLWLFWLVSCWWFIGFCPL